MTSVEPAKYHDVFETVRQWPAEARRDLLRDVLKTLDDERTPRPTRGFSADRVTNETPPIAEPLRTLSLDQIIGILKTDAPPQTDEECNRIIEEERMRKYG